MDDEYPGFPIKIFVDSNVVLEALPLKDLPWSEIDPVGPILIMLTPTLLSEVDSKKRDGRLAVRAREFNRFVAPIAEHGKPINLVIGTPRVDVVIARCRKISWESYDDLDSSQGDDRIIAEVLNTQGIPEKQKLLVSHDINPLFMARRHGLRTRHLSDNWLPLPEPSPQEKEIAKLKGQLKQYSKTEPQFDIELEIQPGKLEVHQVQALTDGEISTLVRDIIATHPKPEQKKQELWSQMTYDDSLDDRYAKYERNTVPNFVKSFHKKIELLFGQFPLNLSVENTGQVIADHIKIDVQIVGGWFNNKPIIIGCYPSAPRVKNRCLDTTLHFPTSPIRVNQTVGRHEIEVNEPSRSEQFSAQCEDFRQGKKWVYSGVVWLDPHHKRETVIIVKVTAANLHGEVSEVRKFDKLVISSHPFDLVDRESGAPVKTYHVNHLVHSAYDKSNFNQIEFDSCPDED